jgi:hypothetical protein
MSERLLAAFPGLRTTPFQVTSPADPTYNCVAWAAGNPTEWWWPLAAPERRTFWPAAAPRHVTVDAFVAALVTVGYSVCTDASLQPGFEKVALFADENGVPTHAARQLPSGRWTSKLSQSEDIEHDLRALEGQVYGTAAVFLRRPAHDSSSSNA